MVLNSLTGELVSESCYMAPNSHTSKEGVGMKTDIVAHGHEVIKEPLAYMANLNLLLLLLA